MRILLTLLLAVGLASCQGKKEPEVSRPIERQRDLVQDGVAEVPQSAQPKPTASAPEPDFAARDAATLPPPQESAVEVVVSPVARAQGPERGMWVWHFECYGDEQERNRLIEFSKKHGITRLLVQMHYEADRSSPDPGNAITIRAPDALGDLVQRAGEAGMVVEALEGDPKWALQSQQEEFWKKFNAILVWNQKQPAYRKLAGVHLDIEPYLLKQFKSGEKPQVMRDYLDLIVEVAGRLKSQVPPMSLAADIPFWYDTREESDEDHHIVEFGGKKQYLSRHVQDLCDYVAVMSYRQKAVGGNSITSTSEGEIAYAEQIGKKAFPSIETTEVRSTPTISFYGTDPAMFQACLEEVYASLRDRKGFGGIMIHHYKSFRDYLDSSKTGDQP